MKSLLSKLGGLLAHEYSLIRGVRGDIQYINDEMASMQAFLGDLSAGPRGGGHDRRMKDWMKQIRGVTYDTEDCVRRRPNSSTASPTAPPAAGRAATPGSAIAELNSRYGFRENPRVAATVRPAGGLLLYKCSEFYSHHLIQKSWQPDHMSSICNNQIENYSEHGFP